MQSLLENPSPHSICNSTSPALYDFLYGYELLHVMCLLLGCCFRY